MKPWLLAILPSVALLLALSAGVAHAMPPLPSAFFGRARIGGADADPGVAVVAWIGDRPLVTTSVIAWQGGSWYSLDVPGDDPDTPGIIEGGQAGDIVHFTLAGLPAAESGSWRSGVNQPLDLSAGLPHESLFLPLILKP